MDSAEKKPSRLRRGLDLASTLSMIVASGFIIWRLAVGESARSQPRSASGAPPLPQVPVSLEDMPIDGNSKAPIGMIQFSDFQCPYCGKFARETLPELRKKYFLTSKAFMAFRHYPIESRHPQAMLAASLATCAADRGLFWSFHDELFKNPNPTTDLRLDAAARASGVSQALRRACSDSDVEKRVRAGIAEAKLLQVKSTPTFFFGLRTPDGRLAVTHRQSGALPIEVFARVLDELQLNRGTR